MPRTLRSLVLLSLVLLLSIVAVSGVSPIQHLSPGPAQNQDAEFARLVREWTTKPEFLSPLVDHLPVDPAVPSPRDVLGYHVGTPGKLTYYAECLNFYRRLASASPRVKVLKIGKTDEGRECVVVAVSSEDSIRNLEQIRGDLGQLADPRRLDEAGAQTIIARTRPIYHLMGGLHSGETGPPEMLMELAYRLAVEDTALFRQIRDNLVVTITPVAEPDGRDRYVDWYYQQLADARDERFRPPGPPYWGKYVLHDNNRDINYSQVTMRALLEWYLAWHPPVMHDLHESVPFLYTFSGQAPQNPTLDPILYGELPWFANFEMAQMTKYGMPGVWTHAFVDMWSPGYLGFMASNHNGLLRMYETFGNGGATTMKRTIGAEGMPGGSQTTREWYRPLPPYKEVEWSMRNNTNYMETGVLSALQLASAFPQVILDNFYRKSRNSIEAGRKEPPYGYVIPAGQRDPARAAFLVNILRLQGIEVGRATQEVRLKEGAFPAGSWIVRRDQPYGRLAKILLEKQEFPDTNLRTYDDTGWTLGLMTHAEVHESADRSILEMPAEVVSEAKAAGVLLGKSARYGYVIAHNGSNNLVTLVSRLKGMRFVAAEQPFRVGEVEYPAGSLIIPVDQAGRNTGAAVRAAVEGLGLEGTAIDDRPAVPVHPVEIPRLAVYSTWGSTQEVGWVRYAFDRFELPFDLIFKERVRQGNLRSSFDVIVMPSQGGSAKRIVYDIEPRDKPIPYLRTERFRNLGMYGESPDIAGGMGLEGLLELRKFVEGGGLLITLGSASFLPVEFGLAGAVDLVRPSAQFYAPGPIIEAEILRPAHPVFYGYSQKTVPVRYANGPILNVPERLRDQRVLMRFPGTDRSVLSGLMRNPAEIRNRPAVVEVPAGKGRILMFATNPCYRWQNHGEFSMLFNPILHHKGLNPN
jgi:hypothetical protein